MSASGGVPYPKSSLLENTVSVSHTPNQAKLRTPSNVERGPSPQFNITSVLSQACFGVWDTDIIPHLVFSIDLSREVTR